MSKKIQFVYKRYSKINLLVFTLLFAGIGGYLLHKSNAQTAPIACTKYAATTGSDSTGTGTLSAPFQTAQKLFDSLATSQVGCLRGGTYTQLFNGGYVLRSTKTGPLTITSYPGEQAVLKGSVDIDDGRNNIILANLNFDLSTSLAAVGIEVYGDNIVFTDNDISGGGIHTCMILGNSSWTAENTLITSNKFHDCGNPAHGNQDHAIYLAHSDNTQIIDNLFWKTAAFAIHFYPNADHTLVTHNVIDSSGYGGVIFASDQNPSTDRSDSNLVEYNTITNGTRYGLTYFWGAAGQGTGNLVRNNCQFNNAYGDEDTPMPGIALSGNIDSNPLYTDVANHNYIFKSGSPCLAIVQYDTAAKLASGSSTPPPDTVAPTTSITAPTLGSVVTGTVNVKAAASDNTGVTKVDFYVDGTLKATSTTSPYGFSWNTAGLTQGFHTLQSKAYDAAGNVGSSAMLPITVNNVSGTDITPPTAPTGLTASAVSPAQVNLKWTASTDNIGVAGYYIKRGGTLITVLSGSMTSYSDGTVAANKGYSYTVTAFDTAGNPSPPSNTAVVSTPALPDTIPPAAPTGFTAVPINSAQVNLSWKAVTDPSGIKGYNVYRGNIKLTATPISTISYGDATVLPNTTYSYMVTAVDGAGNESGRSAAVSVTVPAPPQPVSLTIIPNEDTYVTESRRFRNSNYGSSALLSVDASPSMNTLLKFTVSGVGKRTVTSAKLRLYVNNGSNSGGVFHQITNNSWKESTVTWNTLPSFNTSSLASLGRVNTDSWAQVDLTSLIGGDGTYGVLINSKSADTVKYSSKETGNKPQLILGVQ